MSETAFGGTSLCKQHHIVASVCPYCEIDRLKAELTELGQENSRLKLEINKIGIDWIVAQEKIRVMIESFESFSEQLNRGDLPLSQLVYQAKVMTDKALQKFGGKE